MDDTGAIYFGDASRYSILKILKRDTNGSFSLVGRDSRLTWPDGLAWRNGYLYVSIGQWQRMPALNQGRDPRRPPYQVLRFKAD